MFAARPTLTEQMLTGASAFTAPSCDVDAEDWPPASPRAAAASFMRPMALSCAVIGAFASASPPGSFTPTDVVEQLLVASAPTPTESEQALIGALALATGDDWPVEFVPVVEPWLGSDVLPSSFDRTEMGAATPAGADGSGVDAGAGAVGTGVPVACAAAAAAFCTACIVLCRSVGDDAALAGVTPTAAAAASTSPHVNAPMEVSLLRLMVLLLFCGGWTPLQPRLASYPTKRPSPQNRAKVRANCACTRAARAAVDHAW